MMNNEIDILMVDYGFEKFNKYGIEIAKEIKKESPLKKIAAAYMGKSYSSEDIINGIDKVFCVQDYKTNAKCVLDIYKPKAVILFAHRFFDYMFTLEAHRQGVIVFNFQHGMYMPSTVVSEFSLKALIPLMKSKREQIYIYFKCLYNSMNQDFLKLIKSFMMFLQRKSLYEVYNTLFGIESNADFSFIYGEYWKEYYRTQYKENSDFLVIGYPDLEGGCNPINRGNFSNKDVPVLCYLAQTSVEDGLLSEDTLKTFIIQLREALNTINLVLKFHPRSNKELYKDLLSPHLNGKVHIWTDEEFPIVDGYIGHESTIIARALYITNKVLIYELEEKRISPFRKFTKYVMNKKDVLSDKISEMLNNNMSLTDDKELCIFAFKNELSGAIATTKNKIMFELSCLEKKKLTKRFKGENL